MDLNETVHMAPASVRPGFSALMVQPLDEIRHPACCPTTVRVSRPGKINVIIVAKTSTGAYIAPSLIEFVRSLTEDTIWRHTCFSMRREDGSGITNMLRGRRASARSANQALNN